MKRAIALIAIIFAFASLAGTTTGHAHRYQSLSVEALVVLNHVDEHNVSVPVYVTVQRGEIDLGAGIVMPMGAYHVIAATPPKLPTPPRASQLPAMASIAASPDWRTIPMLRPPKSA